MAEKHPVYVHIILIFFDTDFQPALEVIGISDSRCTPYGDPSIFSTDPQKSVVVRFCFSFWNDLCTTICLTCDDLCCITIKGDTDSNEIVSNDTIWSSLLLLWLNINLFHVVPKKKNSPLQLS